LLIGSEWIVNEMFIVGTTLTFHFVWCRYLEVVAGPKYDFGHISIVDFELLGLFTGLNTDSFFIKEEHIKRA